MRQSIAQLTIKPVVLTYGPLEKLERQAEAGGGGRKGGGVCAICSTICERLAKCGNTWRCELSAAGHATCCCCPLHVRLINLA